MSDPKDAESVEQEVPDEDLDAVAGGSGVDPNAWIIGTGGNGGNGGAGGAAGNGGIGGPGAT